MNDPPGRRPPKPPKTKARLEHLITQWQKDSGQPVALLNLRIAAMMLAGALTRITDPSGEGLFAIKGGIAMELRMGDRARATRDVDLIMRGDPSRLADLLDAGLASHIAASRSRAVHSTTFQHDDKSRRPASGSASPGDR